MAAASYTTDLIDWILDSDTAAWTELTNATSGGAPDEVDTESALQGTNSCSQITNTTALCSMIRILATPITLAAGQVFLMWHGHGVATALNSYANGGLRSVVSGNAVGNWKAWAVGGNDVAPFPYSKWVSTPVDPTVTADYTNGTPPTGGTSIFGVGSMCLLTQAVARGQPHIVDIIRYGRAEARMTGGDLANGYATFAGYAAQNDTVANRWGLIQSTTGGYQWKGLMVLGHASAVDFRTSNVSVFVQDCRKVTSGFNRIEIRQAGSRVDWTNVSIVNAAPDTNASKGALQVVDNADVNFDGCTFTDMDTFVFQSNSTVLDTTFRRCGQVTMGGATMTTCLFTRTTAASALLAGSSTATLSDSAFISDGSSHAIEITAAGTYTLNNLTFTGYAAGNGSTGNETIFVNVASGSVTINSDSAISYRTAGATVTVVAGQKTLTITGIVSGSDIVVLTAGTDTVLASNDGATNPVTTFGYSYTYSPGVTVDVAVYKAGYVPYLIRAYLLENGNASLPVAQVIDRNYTPPSASLRLDFMGSEPFDSRITFTRASTGTYFDAAGTLQSAAINAPRLDHDPATLARRGLLVEEQRTNRIRNNTMVGAVAGSPGTLPTNWFISLGGLTQEVVGIGSFGGVSYIDIRLSGTTTGTVAAINLETITGVPWTNGQVFTLSAWYQIVNGSLANITSAPFTANGYNASSQFISGAITLGSQSAELSTAWQRITRPITGNNADIAYGRPVIALTFSVGVAIDITLRIGLPQLELGEFATSVIPTTTTALTRSADVAAVNTLSPWFNATEGTLFSESRQAQDRTTGFPIVAGISDSGSGANTIEHYWTNSSSSLGGLVYVSSVIQANITSTGLTRTNPQKVAFAYKANDFAGCVNGGGVGTDTSGTIPVVDRLAIGGRPGSGSRINGYIRRITYYPRKLSSAELQAITA